MVFLNWHEKIEQMKNFACTEQNNAGAEQNNYRYSRVKIDSAIILNRGEIAYVCLPGWIKNAVNERTQALQIKVAAILKTAVKDGPAAFRPSGAWLLNANYLWFVIKGVP